MQSKILNCEKKFSVYLPPDYNSSDRSYPVLYLLHGGGGNHTAWVQRGEVKSIADNAIATGNSKSMIIVMPDASSPLRGYGNYPGGKWLYEDFFFKELIPFVENNYRIRKEKRYRAIAGLSAGGRATFYYTMRHPEMFAAACLLSAGLGDHPVEELREHMRSIDPGIPDSLITNWYFAEDVAEMVSRIPENRKNAVRWYIEAGDDDAIDRVYEGNCRLHIAMRKHNIPHEFRISEGEHNWAFWRGALPTVLEFVSEYF